MYTIGIGHRLSTIVVMHEFTTSEPEVKATTTSFIQVPSVPFGLLI